MNQKGFTLIEVLIVVLILGILACLSLPMFTQSRMRTIALEAIVAMRLIYVAEKLYFAEHGEYAYDIADLDIKTRYGGSPTSDLDGTYFSEECYFFYGGVWTFRVNGNDGMLISCIPYESDSEYAPNAEVVRYWGQPAADPYIAMDQNGKIYSDIEELGFEEHPYNVF